MGSSKTPPKPSSEQNQPEFEPHHKQFLHTTTIYLLKPPTTAKTTTPFITAAVNNTNKLQLRHPLTLNHHTHHHSLPPNFNLSKLNPTVLTTAYNTATIDKLIVFKEEALFGLSDGGRLRGLPPHSDNWVSLSRSERESDTELFDDIVVYKDKVYVVDRNCMISTVNFSMSSKMKVGKPLVDSPVPKWARRFEWRKRLVVDEKYLYVVVRTDESKFRVYKVGVNHSEVGYFVYKKLLFVTRDYCFFYEGEGLLRCGNYMVYSDEAFPRYKGDCWEGGKQEFRVFELGGVSYGKHDINEDFRKLDWSPPAWVLDAWLSVDGGDSQTRECLSDREPEKVVGFNSNSRDDKDEEMQSDLKDSNSKDEKDEEMQSDLKDSNSKGDKDEKVQSDLNDSNSKGDKDEKMQSDLKDSNKKDETDEEMQSNLKDSNSKDDKDEEMRTGTKDSNSKGDKYEKTQSDLKDSSSKDDKYEETQSDSKHSDGKDEKDEEMQSDMKDSNSKDEKDEEMQSEMKDLNNKDEKDEEMQSNLKDSNSKGDNDEEMQSDLKDSNSKDEKDEEMQSNLKDLSNKDEKDEEMQSVMKDSNNRDEKDEEMQSDLEHSNSKGDKDEEMQSDLKDSNSKDEKDNKTQSEMNDSNNKDEKDEEMQSNLKNSNSKDEKDEEMQSDLIGQDKEPEVMDLDSNSQDHDDEMECDLNSQGNEDEGVTRSRCSMDGGNDATEQVYVAETSMNTTTQSIPGAGTSCTPKSGISNSGTAKFEGFDIRADLVPTLQTIWQKHGNIVENSSIRSGDIIAKALESLAIMVRILDDNTSESLSGCQADYLISTLSDLTCISFKVDWLSPFIETAVNIHKSKALLDSLDNLSQLSSQVRERRTVLFDKIAKLGEMEKKLEEEMTKVSKVIPFSGKVKLDEPLGLGIT